MCRVCYISHLILFGIESDHKTMHKALIELISGVI